MTETLHILIAESELPEEREARRKSTGKSSGETYLETLQALLPGARFDQVKPVEAGSAPGAALGDYDAVFLSGSPLHLYEMSPEIQRQLDFMRAVFAAGTPSFGSCAGLQVAVVAAGGSVRPNATTYEAGFARRIVPSAAGAAHPLLAGRPAVYDAPALHSDEVESLPQGATLLAGNAVSPVQAAEIRLGEGVFWGVQYHPEVALDEIAQSLRRQAATLVEHGLAADEAAVEAQAVLIETLGHDPARRDLAWRLGLDRQVTEAALRQTELRNFIAHLLRPVRARRGRG